MISIPFHITSTYSKIASVTLIVFFAFILFFVYEVVTEDVPSFFPLNNPKGTYKITKNCPNSQGWEHQPNADGYAYCVEYKGPGVFMDSEAEKHFFRITVGKSRVDLEPYVGKYVRLSGGDFVYSTEQCIQDKCVDIGGPMAMLDVYGVEMVK